MSWCQNFDEGQGSNEVSRKVFGQNTKKGS